MILSPDEATATTAAWGALGTTLKASILANTVLLRSADKRFTGSAVLFFQDGAGTAYAITAKHNLYVLAGSTAPGTSKPSDLSADFQSKVSMFYGPTAMGNLPTTTAAITAIAFPGGGGSTWTYDVMVLSTEDEAFVTFVGTNAIIKNQANAQSLLDLLKIPAKKKEVPALVKASYRYVQTGFGAGKDAAVVATSSYTDHINTCQCRFPEPANANTATVYDLDLANPKSWPKSPTLDSVALLTGGNANSTGQGDSGGPLFALSPRATPAAAWPVGVTLGANFYTSTKFSPTKTPTNARIDNNAVTWLDTVLKEYIQFIPW
jgi:hypothetical protein